MDKDMEVVIVTANDWSMVHDQVPKTHEFGPILGVVVGLLVEKTGEHITVAHQLFPKDGELRVITSIPMSNVISVDYVEITRSEVPVKAG